MLITEFDVDEYIRVSKEEGFEMGREEGREEGRKEGREEGREEGAEQKAKDVAREMKANNIAADIIVKCTGLSEEEIQKL
jgi:predicted transposase/invertase (TIGR01784 family)